MTSNGDRPVARSDLNLDFDLQMPNIDYPQGCDDLCILLLNSTSAR